MMMRKCVTGSSLHRASAPAVHNSTAASAFSASASARISGKNAAPFVQTAPKSALSTNSRRTASALSIIPAAVPTPQEFQPPTEALTGTGSVLLWFKNDLRVDDHPGLVAASSSNVECLTCVYILDPHLLAPLLYTPGGPETLVASLEALRSSLRARGSELIVRTGSAAEVLPQVAQACGAAAVVSEHEVEHEWCQAADSTLLALAEQDGIKTVAWAASVYDPSAFAMEYGAWRGKRGQPQPPLPAPSVLPGPPKAALDPGAIPSAEELRSMLLEDTGACAPMHRLKDAAMQKAAEAVRQQASAGPQAARAARVLSAAVSAGAGPEQVLRSFLGVAAQQQQALSEVLRQGVQELEVPSSRGASFPGLMGTWLSLGALSRRRVLYEAQQAQAQGGNAPAVQAALKAVDAADFHWQLGALAAAQQRPSGSALSVRQWRWRGLASEYCTVEPETPRPGAPAVLLLHGFGAFGDQWRDNAGQIAAAGFRVFCPTLAGFGRTEKGAIGYSQDSWRDYVRDFVLQVVQEPVVLAGNSIGGFIGTSMLADYPALGRGLVLLNSAGPVDAEFTMDKWKAAVAAKKPPPEIVVQLFSRALFWYLERSVPPTLKWLYPTAQHRADEWLAAEILRAAADPGSLEVFQSAFYLPPPRALNYLVKQLWAGPTLVLQGGLDPLNDAKARAKSLAETCGEKLRVVLLEAGHCPMDEQPEQVNAEMIKFIEQDVMGSSSSAKVQHMSAVAASTA